MPCVFIPRPISWGLDPVSFADGGGDGPGLVVEDSGILIVSFGGS